MTIEELQEENMALRQNVDTLLKVGFDIEKECEFYKKLLIQVMKDHNIKKITYKDSFLNEINDDFLIFNRNPKNINETTVEIAFGE